MAVNERGRRQSGGMISLSVGRENKKRVTSERIKTSRSLQNAFALIGKFKRENQRPAAINKFSPLKHGSRVS